jgi:hypothetical protein
MRFATALSGLAALAAALSPIALAARGAAAVHTPGQGSAERRAILDAVRPRVVRDLGGPIEFVVRTLRVSGDHAFVGLEPQRPGGGRIVPRNTRIGREMLRELGTLDMFDCCHTEALLKRTRGVWRVEEIGIGTTDVWYEEPCRTRPRGLCHTSQSE